MKRPYKLKCNFYRRYRSEVRGEVIMRGKITRIFKFLLNYFEFRLKKFAREVVYAERKRIFKVRKKFFLIELKTKKLLQQNIKKKNKLQANNFMPLKNLVFSLTSTRTLFSFSTFLLNALKYKNKKSDIFGDNLLLLFNMNKLQNFSDQCKKLNKNLFKIYKFFWINFNKRYLLDSFSFFNYRYFQKKKNFFFYKKKRYFVFRNLHMWLIKNIKNIKRQHYRSYKWLMRRKKQKSLKLYLFYLRLLGIHRKEFKWRVKKDRHYFLKSWLYLPRTKPWPRLTKWWAQRIEQRKYSLFYGNLNKKKFRFLQSLTFKAMQMQVFAMNKLEFMLRVIIFRFNIFSNMFFIINFIRCGGCLINNNIVTYPYRFVKLRDIVSINPKYFKKIFNKFNIKMYNSYKTIYKKRKFTKYALVTPKILLNVPNYIKANYKILALSIWRLPKKSEVITLMTFPFLNNLGGDWSISVKMRY